MKAEIKDRLTESTNFYRNLHARTFTNNEESQAIRAMNDRDKADTRRAENKGLAWGLAAIALAVAGMVVFWRVF